MKEKKEAKYLLCIAAGFALWLFAAYDYNSLLLTGAEILMAAGYLLLVVQQARAEEGTHKLTFLGMLSFGLGLGLRMISSYIYLQLLQYAGIPLLAIGLLLLVLGMLLPGKKTDYRWLFRIRDYRNRKDALLAGGVSLLGLALTIQGGLEANTVLQLIGMALLGYGIYKLVQSQRRPDDSRDLLVKPQDDQLNQDIRKHRTTIGFWRLVKGFVLIVVFILFVVSAVNGTYGLLIAVAIVGSILYTVVDHHQDKLKAFVGENIVRQALETVFRVEEYRPLGSIPRSHLAGSYFGIGSFDSVGGSDYMRGTYQGLPIELCNIKLTERESRIHEHGRTEEYDALVFQGFWLICDLGVPLSADVCLWERGALGKLVGGKGLQTENEAFHKRFYVESADEREARRILTPARMEHILEMDRKCKGQTHVRFSQDGKVHLAIEGEANFFEVGKGAKDASLLRAQFVREIRMITELIDGLRQTDTL